MVGLHHNNLSLDVVSFYVSQLSKNNASYGLPLNIFKWFSWHQFRRALYLKTRIAGENFLFLIDAGGTILQWPLIYLGFHIG